MRAISKCLRPTSSLFRITRCLASWVHSRASYKHYEVLIRNKDKEHQYFGIAGGYFRNSRWLPHLTGPSQLTLLHERRFNCSGGTYLLELRPVSPLIHYHTSEHILEEVISAPPPPVNSTVSRNHIAGPTISNFIF